MKVIRKLSAVTVAATILTSMFSSLATAVTISDTSSSTASTSANAENKAVSSVVKKTEPQFQKQRDVKPDANTESNKISSDDSKNDKVKKNTGAKIDKESTGDTSGTGSKIYGRGTSWYETKVYDVEKPDGSTWSIMTVRFTYFNDSAEDEGKTKFVYTKNKKSYGKLAKIHMVVGDTVVDWAATKASLTSGSKDDGEGTLEVSRSTSNTDLPAYKYYENGTTSKTGAQIKVKAPWNGTAHRKNHSGEATSDYKSIIDHDKVTKIDIKTSVSKVNNYNFYGFSGKFATLQMHKGTTTIGAKAFATCDKLTDIYWNGTKTFGEGAFYDCDKLASLNLGKDNGGDTTVTTMYNHTLNNPSTSGIGVFQSCDSLSTVNMAGVKTIPVNCFKNCPKLDNIIWGNVETVKAYAFTQAGDNLTLTVRGDKLSKLENESFRNCYYKVVNFTGASKLTSTGNYTFYSSDYLETVSISSGAGITTIGNSSFKSCKKLKQLNILSTKVTKIEAEAFRECGALVSGKALASGDADIYGYQNHPSASGVIYNSRTSSNYNVLELPYSISSIEQGAFQKCTTLRAVTFYETSTNKSSLKEITYDVFYNDYQLQFFALPDSVRIIRGTPKDDTTGKHGAFVIDERWCGFINSGSNTAALANDSGTETVIPSQVQLNHQFYFAVSSNKASKLETIGDKAFLHPQMLKSNNGSGDKKGVVLYDKSNRTAATSTTLFKFANLNYIGTRAFMNAPELTGCILSECYTSLASRAFANTKLTDFYFKWDKNAAVDDLSITTVASSVIGSSSTFVNANGNGYDHEAWRSVLTSNGYSSINYTSIYSLIFDSAYGLIAYWSTYFSDVINKNNVFDNWSGKMDTHTGTNTPSHLPTKGVGTKNGTIATDSSPQYNMKTSTYLGATAQWQSGYVRKKANLDVSFAYKNKQQMDYIFVVDNSPSMDRAAHDIPLTDRVANGNLDVSEQDSPYDGMNKASKMMNAYSQIYDISAKLLAGQTSSTNDGNTVSVISFRGDNSNTLKNSYKFVTEDGQATGSNNIPMSDSDTVKAALFHTNYGYEDNNDGVTNYGAGLCGAYNLISTLRQAEIQNGRPARGKVVIFMSDGAPTYYDTELQAVSALPEPAANDNSDIAAVKRQVNGVSWANAIRGKSSYPVYSLNNSFFNVTNGIVKSSYSTTTRYTGLGVPIYGILLGGSKKAAMSSIVGPAATGANENAPGFDVDYLCQSTDMTDCADFLSDTVRKIQAENYKVVIPLDNNFVLYDAYESGFGNNQTKQNGISVDVYSGVVSGSTTTHSSLGSLVLKSKRDENNNLTNEYAEQSSSGNSYQNFKITYNDTRNCLIIDFSTRFKEKSTTPYRTYTAHFPLKYVGSFNDKSGRKVNYGTTSQYWAVSDNSTDTSANSTNSLVVSNKLNKANTNGNASDSTSRTSGSYVTLGETTVSNFMDALYLPVPNYSFTLNKYKTKIDTTTGSETADGSLAGATFALYDSNSKDKVKFTKTTKYSSGPYDEYTVSDSDEATDSIAVPSYSVVITNLPAGIYYLKETKCPTGYTRSDFRGTNDSVYSRKSFKDVRGNLVTDAMEIIVSSSHNNFVVREYNKLQSQGKVVGQKYGTMTYWYSDPREYLYGVKLGIYSTWNDAVNRTNPIATTYTDSGESSYYYFNMSDLQPSTTYYISEIQPLDGYQNADIIRQVTTDSDPNKNVNSYVRGGSENYGYIWNVPLRHIRVITDSSDAVRNGYDIKLTGSYRTMTGNLITPTYSGRTQSSSNFDDTVMNLGDYADYTQGVYQFDVPAFYGYSRKETTDKITPQFTQGIILSSGADATNPSGKYYRTDYKSLEFSDNLHNNVSKRYASISVNSSSAAFNIFWYDSSHNFIKSQYTASPPSTTGIVTIPRPSNAYYFKVLLYNADGFADASAVSSALTSLILNRNSSDYRIQDYYNAITYTVKETGYNGGAIPGRYMSPQYALGSRALPYSTFEDCTTKTEQITDLNSNWNGRVNGYGENPSGYFPWTSSSDCNVHPKNSVVLIYNPSIKLTVHDFDYNDKTLPLSSIVKVSAASNTTSSVVPTASKRLNPQLFQSELVDWTSGSIQSSGEYTGYANHYRSNDYMLINKADFMRFDIDDNADGLYKYNVYFYDSDKKFISSVYTSESNFATSSFKAVVPNNAYYYHVLRIKNSNIPIRDQILNIDKYRNSAAKFSQWFGSRNIILEQTYVEPDYQLLNNTYNLASNVAGFVNYTTEHDVNGRRYYQLDVTLYNNKGVEFPKVGSNGIRVYILIGTACVLSSGTILLLKRKKRRLSRR